MKKEKLPRPSLKAEELEKLTIDELLDLKLNPEEIILLKQINQKRRAWREASTARLKEEEKQLVADINQAGYLVDSVWVLKSRYKDYSNAIPILLEHLPMPYSDVIKDGIARALAVRDDRVKKAWPLLVSEYMKARDGKGFSAPGDDIETKLGAKEGLATALAAAVSEETLPELIRIIKCSDHGGSRVFLLEPLKKRRKKNSAIAQLIAELSQDPMLNIEISSWKK